MERHSYVRMFVAVVGLMAAAGAARAEDAPAAAPAAAAAPERRSLIGMKCKDDAAKLCAGVAMGGGKLARCLRLHENDLSEPCKAALAAAADKKGAAAAATTAAAAPGATVAEGNAGHGGMMGKGMGMGMGHEWGPMKDMHKSCSADMGKFCKDVQPGHGRIAVCLNEHAAELSPACKKSVDTVTTQMNAHMEMHADCAGDVQKLCPDMPAGSGRVAMCLGEHTKELTPACKKHVDDMKAHWKKHMGAAQAQNTSGTGGAPGTAPAALPPVPPAPSPAKK